jgi:Tol biopolymer transport system component/DNA-binding winged helix-turn-helix (wHTH) protein
VLKIAGRANLRNTQPLIPKFKLSHFLENQPSSGKNLMTKELSRRLLELIRIGRRIITCDPNVQMTTNSSKRACFGPFEVDLHTHELWKFGTRIRVGGQPFEILAVLLRQPGELVTREELRGRLWPEDTFVDFNHGLNAAVNKLREALSDSADEPRYVETLPRRGYRFIAKVEWIQGASARGSIQPETGSLPARPQLEVHGPVAVHLAPEYVAGRSDGESRTWHGAFLYLTGIGALFTVLLAAAFFLTTTSGSRFEASEHRLVENTRTLLSISDTNAPAFSPDGNSVAFSRQHSAAGGAGIYVTGVGSDHLAQLTSNDSDCCPVWSPDGRWIAFSRASNREYSIYLVPAEGGREQKLKADAVTTQSGTLNLASATFIERKLDTTGVVPHRGEIDWSPDGKSIAFAGPSGIYIASVENSSVHRITQPPSLSEDWAPKFSPDGTTLLFVRDQQAGFSNEIQSVSAKGGISTHIFSEPGRIASPPQWSYDGRSIIFSSNRTGHPVLWRLSLDAPDSVVQISEAGSPAWDPAVSRRGYRLAYERLLRSLSIWQMDLSSVRDKRPYLIVTSTSDTDQGPGPQFSPDGQRLAYMSDRSGTMEIWISNRDGSNPFQLTAVGGAGTPRWSPDSQAVVFDVSKPDGRAIVSMNLHGGAPLVLTSDKFDNVCPSWSRDGKWVYFASSRTGEYQVWKTPSQGGMPVQVTQHGGHAALESLDGKFVYYAKNSTAEPEIWRVPVNTKLDGREENPLPLLRPGTWASWQVVTGGILFVGPSLGHQAVLSFYDFAKDRTSTVTVLDRIPFWLGATPDGRTVAFDQPGREQDQAMLVENFR